MVLVDTEKEKWKDECAILLSPQAGEGVDGYRCCSSKTIWMMGKT